MRALIVYLTYTPNRYSVLTPSVESLYYKTSAVKGVLRSFIQVRVL